MMDAVRYEPGEAIRWLAVGAEDLKDKANREGKSVWQRVGERSLGKDVRQVAGALMDLSKGALAELKHRQAEAVEYVLHDTRLEEISGGNVREVKYSEVVSIRLRDDTAVLILDRGTLEIKPFAHIISGRIKVPIGWRRNGIEVPFNLLVDELSARTGRPVEAE